MPDRAQLLPHHARLIEMSAISASIAKERGYRSVSVKADLRRLGFRDRQCRVPALLIPILDVNGDIATYQVRPDEARIESKGKPRDCTPSRARSGVFGGVDKQDVARQRSELRGRGVYQRLNLVASARLGRRLRWRTASEHLGPGGGGNRIRQAKSDAETSVHQQTETTDVSQSTHPWIPICVIGIRWPA